MYSLKSEAGFTTLANPPTQLVANHSSIVIDSATPVAYFSAMVLPSLQILKESQIFRGAG